MLQLAGELVPTTTRAGYGQAIDDGRLRHQHLRDANADGIRIETGEFYEDCSYEPLVCVLADYEADEVTGISLVN